VPIPIFGPSSLPVVVDKAEKTHACKLKNRLCVLEWQTDIDPNGSYERRSYFTVLRYVTLYAHDTIGSVAGISPQ